MTSIELIYTGATALGLAVLLFKDSAESKRKGLLMGLSAVAFAYLAWIGRGAELLAFAISHTVAARDDRIDVHVLVAVVPALILVAMQPLSSGAPWVLPCAAFALAFRPSRSPASTTERALNRD